MENFNSKLSYTANPERYQKWEKEPVPVFNILTKLGLINRQKIEGKELAPNQIVDIDDRALRQPQCISVIFGRPHAGEFIPTQLADRFTPEGENFLALTDRATTEIFRSEKIPSAGTKISRFIVDPNRAPMMEMNPANPSVMGKVLWKEGLYDEKIYKSGQEPNDQEIQDLVERLYLPYYRAMMGLIGSLADRRKNKKERVLVIDGHSFVTHDILKDVYKRYNFKDYKNLPMFIVGDSDGKTCDIDIRDAFIFALEKRFSQLPLEVQKDLKKNISGDLISVNKPFKGVHNVQFYGQKEQGINSLQLELNEAAYMDEAGDYYHDQYNEKNIKIMNVLIVQACADIDDILKGKK